MNHRENCALAASLVTRTADLLRGADLATPVPTCPGWDLGRLVVHLGGVHRWATQMVASLAQERQTPVKADRGPDLVAWLASGADLVAGMAAADPDAPMWAWGKDQHVRFWSRRMVHETAVHYADAAIALGAAAHLEAAVAIDGIDELLENLPYAAFSPNVANLKGEGSIHLHGTDADHAEWMISLSDDGYTVDHSHGKGSVAVRGPVADLYLLMSNRRALHDPMFEIFGDESVVSTWLANATL
jgi:uncharacterized protein (TIGR03083 family)